MGTGGARSLMGGNDESALELCEAGEAAEEPAGLSICLVSGGMDSCVTAAIAREQSKTLAFLHVSYRQLTEDRERLAFENIADHYGVEHRLAVSIESLSVIGGSSLTDATIAVSAADLHSRRIPASYVPFRKIGRASCRERV